MEREYRRCGGATVRTVPWRRSRTGGPHGGRQPAVLLRSLFWDYDFNRLSWAQDCDLVTRRCLEAGSWEAVCWLRRRLGDDALRAWLRERRGAGLGGRKLRFWENILDLPRKEVDSWLAAPERTPWEQRVQR